MQTNYLTYRDAVFASSADTLEYVIRRGEDTVFRGIAIKAPGADYAYIPVGEICRGYLNNPLPSDFDQLNDYIMKQLNAWASFELFSVHRTSIWTGPETYIEDITEQPEGVFNFLLNWEYIGDSWDGERRVLSDPINGRIDPRMRFVYTEFNLVNCNCFSVTPLLSAPSSGATLEGKIVVSDEYDDPSKLELVVDSGMVDVDNISLSGVTFIVSPNTGYNQEIRVEYWYDGEYKGTTVIISAGDMGENPNGDSGSGGSGVYGRRSNFQYGIPGTAMYSGGTWEYNTLAIAQLLENGGGYDWEDFEFREEAPNDYLKVVRDPTAPLFFQIRLKDGVRYAPLGETLVVRAYAKTGPNVRRLIAKATFIVTSLYKRDYPGWENSNGRWVNVTDISACTIVDSISVNYTGNTVSAITAVNDLGRSTRIVLEEYNDGYNHCPFIEGSQRTDVPTPTGGTWLSYAPFNVRTVEYCRIEKTGTGYTLYSSVWLYYQACNNWIAPMALTYGFSEFAQLISVDLSTLTVQPTMRPSIVRYSGTLADFRGVWVLSNEDYAPQTVICDDGTVTLSDNTPSDLIPVLTV